MRVTITSLAYSARFAKEIAKAPPDIQRAARECLQHLLESSASGSLRVHPLKGYKPLIFKLDVLTNHSWQISLHLDGEVATLLRLCTHSEMDRAPR